MSCNGFGHTPDCECGWGGEFYGNEEFRYSLQHWQRLESHTNPNAKCPACGEPVFFYRSPDGGCAFFEELGPLWPKHDCSCHRPESMRQPVTTASERIPSWPFVWVEKWPLPGKDGTLLVDVDERQLYVRTNWLKIPLWTPVWISRHPTILGRYRASFPRVKNDMVFESAFDAYTLESLRLPEHAKLFQTTIQQINEQLASAERSQSLPKLR